MKVDEGEIFSLVVLKDFRKRFCELPDVFQRNVPDGLNPVLGGWQGKDSSCVSFRLLTRRLLFNQQKGKAAAGGVIALMTHTGFLSNNAALSPYPASKVDRLVHKSAEF
jgi:hypothetical protein